MSHRHEKEEMVKQKFHLFFNPLHCRFQKTIKNTSIDQSIKYAIYFRRKRMKHWKKTRHHELASNIIFGKKEAVTKLAHYPDKRKYIARKLLRSNCLLSKMILVKMRRKGFMREKSFLSVASGHIFHPLCQQVI